MTATATAPETETDPEAAAAEAALLAELTSIADRLDELKALYARRTDLWIEGRARTPKIVQRRLAEASRVNEVMVIKAIKKAGLDDE